MNKFLQRKHLWVIPVYALFYLAAFKLLEAHVTKGYHVIHMALDDVIPFCEYFIVPYMTWFLFIAVTVFFFSFINKDVKEFYQLIFSLGIGMTLFLIISWVYPNGQDLRPVVFDRENIFVNLVRRLYEMDTPTNIFPSIHVYNSLAVYFAIARCKRLQKHPVIVRGSFVLAVLIILSTMFLKQHSVFDVMCGLALYAVVYGCLYMPGQRQRQPGKQKLDKKSFL
ncbi:MAG: phosphatase PAP2 family protein [Lachnospiraceae bacterium]|nr:phosphatase PAP2 family protein [Lachnospiraceae bacterium]